MAFDWLKNLITGTSEVAITGVSAIGNVTGSVVNTVRDGFEDVTHRSEIRQNQREASVAGVRTESTQQRMRIAETHGRTLRDLNVDHEEDVNQQSNVIREQNQTTIEKAIYYSIQMYQITANSVTTMTNTQTSLTYQNPSTNLNIEN